MRRWAPLPQALVLGLAACAAGDNAGFGTGSAGNDTGFTTTTGSNTSAGETGSNDGHASTDGGETGDMPPPEATCDDGEQNQGESDIDCGGPNCEGCDIGDKCTMDEDCALESCVGNVCVSPDCGDGVQNGDETDVDCGGSCGPCDDNLGCQGPGDCESGVCTNGTCTPPSCGDGIKNGSETDVDCGGGGNCDGCDTGEMCNGNPDCISQDCQNGTCAQLVCANDSDCDDFDGQCAQGQCMGNACMAVAANENQACDSGDLCLMGTTCSAGSCGGGQPVDCSNLSDQCHVGTCNDQNGQCEAEIANEGKPCNDQNACTVSEVCGQGVCAEPNAPGYFFHENFANNNAGWTLGTEWQIAAAAASACAVSCPGNDPGTDHTPTGDNGIAGVLIGSCQAKVVHDYYWLKSPKITTPNNGQKVYLTYWRHLHTDYLPYMNSRVEYSVDNSTWNLLWQTANSCVNDNAWTEQSFELPLAANSVQVWVRWGYNIGSTGVFSAGIWNLDDVTVGPAACTPG